MTWSESISAAISYIEDHLAEPLSVEEVAPRSDAFAILFPARIRHALRHERR